MRSAPLGLRITSINRSRSGPYVQARQGRCRGQAAGVSRRLEADADHTSGAGLSRPRPSFSIFAVFGEDVAGKSGESLFSSRARLLEE